VSQASAVFLNDPEKLGAWYREHLGLDLDVLLAQPRREGVEVDERTEKSDFGYFGWAMDPEGNRIELWEPPEIQSASPQLLDAQPA
jgi:hypothetical protein